MRVRVRTRRVCGAEGESLEPRQADGLLRTSSFRFRFFTTHGASERSRYEFNNADSAGPLRTPPPAPRVSWPDRARATCGGAGVAQVLQRHREGRLLPFRAQPAG